MSEARDELLARIRLTFVRELGLAEQRIPSGWNYKLGGKIVAFAGKKRALSQVSAKLPADRAREALRRVDVEPHPNDRLAASNWITINVYEEAQWPFILECVQHSIGETGAKTRATGS